MINFDDFIRGITITHNPNWPWIPEHSYGILVMRRSGSEKTMHCLI